MGIDGCSMHSPIPAYHKSRTLASPALYSEITVLSPLLVSLVDAVDLHVRSTGTLPSARQSLNPKSQIPNLFR